MKMISNYDCPRRPKPEQGVIKLEILGSAMILRKAAEVSRFKKDKGGTKRRIPRDGEDECMTSTASKYRY
jgi:hypothetical protein